MKKLTCKIEFRQTAESHQECRMGYIDRAINHNRMLKKRTLSSSDFLLEVFSQTIPYWDLCTLAGRHTACALLWKRIQPYIHCLVYSLSSTLPWDDLSLFWCCHLDGYLTGILKIIPPEILQSQVGRSGVDRASSSDARGPGFEPRPLRFKKYHFFTPKP